MTSNITAVVGLTRALLAALPVATRAMNPEKSSGGRSRVRTSGQKPHLVQEDAAQAVTRAACRATRSKGYESSA